ncbi:PREDICTED: inositol monophosphatase 2-like [Dufourea novaeangliae]|uniref:inositol monophosphatase 2-like n=1 Tax=Dufourea novaeangliae TaxID=178035 RepID=UPI000767502F|nr:PREDICTED: inositol monophosphatase 2-like [Dufourea novaeangliae]
MARYAEDVYYEFAVKLTHDAAQILKTAINGLKKVDEKLGNWDLVTEYDRKIEDVIIGNLRSKFPNHRFIAEESTGKELPELTNDPTWIIDPIDGTTNFIHGFPHTCVVIGLAIQKEMVIGIVYNPVLEQLFTARKGRGAFLNGKPIKVSEVQGLSKALVCMEAGFMKVDYLREKTIERQQSIVREVQGIRTLGVAALTLCYVALGIVEAYYIEGPGISTWDIAAASLIITEAGGVVLDRVTGEKIDIMKPRAVGACNDKIAREIVRIIHEADQRVENKNKCNKAIK